MKKIILVFIFLTSIISHAQTREGELLNGSIPILRTSFEQSDTPTENDLQQRTTIITTPTGSSTETGVTPGQLSVSLNGAANYNIPINIPPGINGIAPQISLNYSSQRGNGLAGFGWNINGVSVITRIPSTKIHDGTIDPVDFDNYDRFALDGQRLVLKNVTDSYGGNGTVYETESFSNLKITSLGVHPQGANYGPAYFKIEYPDGSFAIYGNSTDSRTIADWAITYSQNPQGVRINYNYNNSSNSLYISSISYGALSTGTPINIINFDYTGFSRTRTEVFYLGGLAVVKTPILNKISVIGDGVGYRNYELTYDATDLGYNRLIKVTEKNGNNTLSYNPTVFNYDNTADSLFSNTSTSSLSVSNINFSNSVNVSGDFNGDGKMDFVIYPTTGTDAKKMFWLFDNIQGQGTNMGWSSGTIAPFETIFASTWLSGNNKFMPYQGITVVQNETTTPGKVNFNTYYDAPGIAFQYSKTVTFPNADPKKYLSGDFNGDGLTDVIAIDASQHYVSKSYFIDLDRRNSTTFFNFSGTLDFDGSHASLQLFVIDFNGDGKSDIISFCPNRFTSVYSLNDSNQLVLLYAYPQGIFGQTNSILIGDYNGDGKTDFMIPDPGTNINAYDLYTSTGTYFAKSDVAYEFPFLTTDSIYSYTLIPNDYNNDGKTDMSLVTTARYTFNPINHNVIAGDTYGFITVVNYKNLGNNFVFSSGINIGKNTGAPHYQSNTGSTAIKRYPAPIFLSTNSASMNLSLSFMSNNSVYSVNSNKDFSKETLLKSITNGNGVVENISYKPLIDTPCIPYCDGLRTYAKDYSSQELYPNVNIDLSTNLQVVSSVSKNGLIQDYGYFGAVSNTQGLGFLGFKATAKTNFYNNVDIPRTTNVSIFDTSLRGTLVADYIVLGVPTPLSTIPSDFISKNIYTYNTYDNSTYEPIVLPNKVFKLKNTIIENTNALHGTSEKSTNNIFDQYNNVIKNTNEIKLGTIVQKTIVTDMIFDNDPTSTTDYHIGRPTNRKIATTVGSSIMKTEEQFAYGTGTSAGLVTQMVKFVDDDNSKTVTESNDYDIYGNITQKNIAGSDGTSRTTYFLYDDSVANHYGGRFLTKSTDVDGLFIEYTYNSSTGLLSSKTSPFNTITDPIYSNYFYDSWGKVTSVKNYLGSTLTNDLSYTYSNNLSSLNNYSISMAGNDGSESKTFYDPLDRPYISGYKNISGNWSYYQIEYDNLGRKIKVSEPYFSTASPPTATGSVLWNQTSYDSYGRINQTIDAAQKTTTVNYTGLTTSVNDSYKTKTTTRNATGTIASVTDPGGTITYEYYANDNLKSSSLGVNQVTITQNGWGRKITLSDPAAGVYSYDYNLLGEVTKETTPKGTTNYTIDNLTGKLTQKTIVGDLTNTLTTFTYHPTTKLLTYSKYNDYIGGYYTEYSYEYDNYKRLYVFSENSFNAYLYHAYLYDSNSRPRFELYGAISNGQNVSKWVTHTYLNGHHWQILDGISGTGAMLWQTEAVNERGQTLEAYYGNAVGYEKHTYDALGFQTKVDFKTTSNGNTFLSLETAFDQQKGNLNSRNYFSSNINSSQTFGYDSLNLDRLTTITEAGVTTNQTYDESGRITSNELGTYNYSKTTATPANPYTNTSISINQTNPDNLAYYWNKYPVQTVTYNAIKKPVAIYETGRERLDFQYNDFGQRSTMFFGGTQVDKTQRPLRRTYSADGSIEVTTLNPNSSPTDTFIFYIGGNAYTAPLILKSDGTNQDYYYLHRDYQGSILAISDATGQLVEKRLFDAWGQLVKYRDAAGNTSPVGGRMFIDRGYTGHEHLFPSYDVAGTTFLGYGLINMNGRLYDPKLRRFFMPDNNIQDPYNTQNYNRYGYVLNNPLKGTDPSGETCDCPESGGGNFDGAATGSAIASAITTLGENWDRWRIKEWANRNLNIKNMSNSASDGLKDAGNWIARNADSLLRDIGDFLGLGGSRKYPVTIRTNNLNGPLPFTSGLETGNFMSGNNGPNSSFMYDRRSGYKGPMYSQAGYTAPSVANPTYDISNAASVIMGTLVEMDGLQMYDKAGDTWFSLNKMKTYNISNYNGNFYTGWKSQALNYSNKFKWTGRGLGAINAYSINSQFTNGEIGAYNMFAEQSSNAYSTFGGLNGAAWGIGWEIGRWFTYRDFYQNWKHNTWLPWKRMHLPYLTFLEE